jgi:hypothetical protein
VAAVADPHRGQALIARLDAVEARIHEHAARELRAGLTAADPETGEQWDGGQVWAHVADILPYWLTQAQRLIDSYAGEPVPFGRTRTDPGRIDVIERNRHQTVELHWGRLHEAAGQVRELIANADERAWTEVKGLHRLRGAMGLSAILTDFMIAHLEEHADQLDSLVAATPG